MCPETPDPFNVRRCTSGYVCFDPLGPNTHHLTPADALALGERLLRLAREEALCPPHSST